jgi:hypothetical protein
MSLIPDRCGVLRADRDMLKLTQQEYDSVPLPIIVEVLTAAVLCMWGAQLFQA